MSTSIIFTVCTTCI